MLRCCGKHPLPACEYRNDRFAKTIERQKRFEQVMIDAMFPSDWICAIRHGKLAIAPARRHIRQGRICRMAFKNRRCRAAASPIRTSSNGVAPEPRSQGYPASPLSATLT